MANGKRLAFVALILVPVAFASSGCGWFVHSLRVGNGFQYERLENEIVAIDGAWTIDDHLILALRGRFDHPIPPPGAVVEEGVEPAAIERRWLWMVLPRDERERILATADLRFGMLSTADLRIGVPAARAVERWQRLPVYALPVDAPAEARAKRMEAIARRKGGAVFLARDEVARVRSGVRRGGIIVARRKKGSKEIEFLGVFVDPTLRQLPTGREWLEWLEAPALLLDMAAGVAALPIGGALLGFGAATGVVDGRDLP